MSTAPLVCPLLVCLLIPVGHNSILKSCTLEDECLIGIGAVISEGCHVSTHSMVAAGSILAPNTTVPSGEVYGFFNNSSILGLDGQACQVRS